MFEVDNNILNCFENKNQEIKCKIDSKNKISKLITEININLDSILETKSYEKTNYLNDILFAKNTLGKIKMQIENNENIDSLLYSDFRKLIIFKFALESFKSVWYLEKPYLYFSSDFYDIVTANNEINSFFSDFNQFEVSNLIGFENDYYSYYDIPISISISILMELNNLTIDNNFQNEYNNLIELNKLNLSGEYYLILGNDN
ncbi:MAG: hypothetical protein IPJ22_01360 [Bacteroidetes bacterium]|nr:hypothetical protein [Bacteroidota bacterium]